MQKFYNIIFSILFLPLCSLAQTNYKPGYVVTLKGDTLHGFIDYKEWDKNPTDIRFKNKVNAVNAENYSPQNIGAFAVNGLEYYRRFTVTISQDQLDIGKLMLKPDSTTKTDVVFLKTITSGKHVELYAYTDDIKSRFYILETGEVQPRELVYHAYYTADQSTSVHYIRRYRTQLENLAQKYEVNTDQLKTAILQTNYVGSDLVKIVQDINGSFTGQFTAESLLGVRLFAGASVNYTSLTFAGTINFPKSSNITPKISVGMDFMGNKNTQHVFFRMEIAYSNAQYKLHNKGDYFTYNGSPYSFNFKQSTIALSPQIVYNIYNSNKVKFFVNGGIIYNFSSYDKYYLQVQNSGSIPQLYLYGYPSLSKTWLVFAFKTGVLLNKRLEIYAAYNAPSDIKGVSSDTSTGTINTVAAGLNYLFGAK
jgi:hypothetical protein